MPLTSQEKSIQEEGKDKKAFVVTFTNGAFDQLEELRQFMKATDKEALLRMAISVLEDFKDRQTKKDAVVPSK